MYLYLASKFQIKRAPEIWVAGRSKKRVVLSVAHQSVGNFWVKSSLTLGNCGRTGNHRESRRVGSWAVLYLCICAASEMYLFHICIVFVWRAGRVGKDVVRGGNIAGNGQLRHRS